MLNIAQNNLEKCNDEVIFTDGKYVGCINEEKIPSGLGTYYWTDKSVYEGYWENGLRSGFGVYTSKEGYVYNGYWLENMKNGEGKSIKRTDISITTEIGNFKNNRLIEGTKKVDYPNGFFSLSTITSKAYIGIINKEINLTKGPGDGYEVLKSLIPGTKIFIISDKTENDYYNVIDIDSSIEGYVHKSNIELGEEVKRNENKLFVPSGKSDTSLSSKIEVFNDSKHIMTLKLGNINYVFSPYEKSEINVKPGKYTYIVSAVGVNPFYGREEVESGNNYKWGFYIIYN